MKYIKIMILIYVVFGFITLSCEKDDDNLSSLYVYYWGNNKKIVLKEDTTKYIMCFQGQYDIEDIKEILYNGFNVEEVEELNTNYREFLIAKGGNIHQLGLNPESIPEIDYIMPVYLQNGSELIVVNKIILKLKPDIEIKQILDLINNEATVLVEKSRNRYTLVPKESDNLFDIANKIYESKLVEYSQPEFLANYIVP